MERSVDDFDRSVAVEGFRQVQMANEHLVGRPQQDVWLEQFLANARKAFGLRCKQNEAVKLARELEQQGYFGFAHYLELRARRYAVNAARKSGVASVPDNSLGL